MRMMILPACWLASAVLAGAEASGEAAPEKPGTLATVEESIPEPVKALGKPAMVEFANGIRMAVSSVSERAQEHVLQGLNHLHGGWEFEASRHFACAMREDPECLLAHWGMIMALLNPSPETSEARMGATDRLLELIEAGKGTELERGYAYGIVKYLEEGPEGAAEAYRKVAARFPNELQAGVFAALFGRGGFDPAGDPTPTQQAAEKSLMSLMEKHPNSPVPLNALLMIRAESPDLRPSLELARKLCRMVPDYAPYFHLLGHYEWRCGNHGNAASAFGKASTFFQRWMRETGAGVADCPEWTRAECYRIVSLASRGDFETAYAAARQVASTQVPADRPASPGARFLLWDAKTLPARILLHRGLRGNANEAFYSLPRPEELAGFRDHTLAYWWIDGLRFVLEAQQLIDRGDLEEARNVVAALTHHGESMARTQKAAGKGGEMSPWIRSFRALEVLASDVRGRLALMGPADLKGTAFNWFASATDRQHPSPMLMPPLVLTPMASRLGDYFMQSGNTEEAISAYQRALSAFPNDSNSLGGLLRAYQKAGMQQEADGIQAQLDALKE